MKVHSMRNFKPIAMDKVRSKSDYVNRELYVYYFAPVIFSAIEKEIGEEKMWQWIKGLLQTPTVFTNYKFFEQTLNKVVNDKNKFDALKEKYLSSDGALQNAIATLHIQSDEPVAEGEKPSTRKYYFFFYSGPIIDAGSSQNKVIKHTEVLEFTCTPEEFSKIEEAIYKKAECENEGGCSARIQRLSIQGKG